MVKSERVKGVDEKRKDDENPIVIYTSQDGQVHVKGTGEAL